MNVVSRQQPTGTKRTTLSIGVIGIALALMVLAVPRAGAASPVVIAEVNCDLLNCFGSTYKLVIDDGGTTDTNYIATLIVDTSEYSGTQGFISAVDFKVSSSVTSASLTSAPGIDSNWNTVWNLGQAGGNCSGSGTGFVTSCDAAPVTGAPIGGVLTWSWNFATSGAINFGHLGVKYNNAAGTTPGQLLSADATKVPEPTSLSLLGFGLVSLGAAGRNQIRRRP